MITTIATEPAPVLHPVALRLLLLLHYTGDTTKLTSPVERDSYAHFVKVKLAHQRTKADERAGIVPRDMLTDRGHAHVQALISLPLPTARTIWETPK